MSGKKVGDQVFHVPSGEPQDPGAGPLGVGEISRVVHLSDQAFPGSDAAGRRYLVVGVLAHRDVYRIEVLVLFRKLRRHIDEDPVCVDPAELLVSVPLMFRENTDQAAFLQLFYVAGEGSVGDSQAAGNFIHIHFALFQQEFNDLDPQVRPQGFIKAYTIFNFFDMQHRRTPLLRCMGDRVKFVICYYYK